jgi:hypothetical protein
MILTVKNATRRADACNQELKEMEVHIAELERDGADLALIEEARAQAATLERHAANANKDLEDAKADEEKGCAYWRTAGMSWEVAPVGVGSPIIYIDPLQWEALAEAGEPICKREAILVNPSQGGLPVMEDPAAMDYYGGGAGFWPIVQMTEEEVEAWQASDQAEWAYEL